MAVSAGVAVAIGAAVVVLFLIDTVQSVRRALRTPSANEQALRVHDRAAGSLGRAAAIVSCLACAGVLAARVAGPDSGWRVSLTSVPLLVGGAVALLVLMAVESRWPVPGGTLRAAGLQPRRAVDILPAAGMWFACGAVLADVVTALLCSTLPHPIMPTPRPGAVADAVWPSWGQTAPDLLGLAGVLLLAVLAVRQLLRRPALAGFGRDADLAYRRSGVDRALRVVSFLALVQVSGMLGSAGTIVADATRAAHGLSVLGVSSMVVLALALVSIPVWRARPPKGPGLPAPTVPAASR